MDHSFYRSAAVNGPVMGTLLKRSDRPGLWHFAVLYPLFVATAVALIYTWDQSWAWRLPLLLLFGAWVCSLFACEHEAVHHTAFKTPAYNRIAAFLAGLGYGYAPTMFRNFHFAHHLHTHQPGLDPEISMGGRPIPSVVDALPSYLAWLSGFPFFLFRLFMLIAGVLGMPKFLRTHVFPFFDEKDRGKLWVESCLILGVHGLLLYLAVYVDARFWGWFAGQLVGSALLASYTAAEHNGLEHEGNILQRTRSIKANPAVSWLMWNMNYHAEHHAYPAVPFYALPQLHQHLKDELVHQDLNHAGFHAQVMRDTTIGKIRRSKSKTE